MRTGNHDRGTRLVAANARLERVGIAHVDNQHLDALIMAIVLACRTLVALVGVAFFIIMGKLGLHTVANLHDSEIGRDLQHGCGDDISHAIAELFVDALTTCFANHGGNDALGVLRGDAAHVVGGNVALLEFAVLARLFIGLADGNELVYIDTARGAVNRDASVPLKVENVLVAPRKRSLQALDQVEFVDLFFMCKGLQSLHQFRCHDVPSSLHKIIANGCTR